MKIWKLVIDSCTATPLRLLLPSLFCALWTNWHHTPVLLYAVLFIRAYTENKLPCYYQKIHQNDEDDNNDSCSTELSRDVLCLHFHSTSKRCFSLHDRSAGSTVGLPCDGLILHLGTALCPILPGIHSIPPNPQNMVRRWMGGCINGVIYRGRNHLTNKAPMVMTYSRMVLMSPTVTHRYSKLLKM